MRITLSGSTALELYLARVGGLPFDALPIHISGLTVDLDIRPGDFVEVVDQDTGELDYGRILDDSFDRFLVKTINGLCYRCAQTHLGVRVQLEGTQIPSQSGSG